MADVLWTLEAAVKLLIAWTDFALDKGIDAIIATLGAAKAWLLKKKKDMLDAIAGWLETGYRGLKMLVIVYAVGAVIVAVQAVLFLIERKVKLGLALKALRELDTLSRIKLSVQALKIAWEVLTQVDARFADLEKSFYAFAQAFDETFGYPLGFLSSFASAYREYLRALYTMAGFSDVDARVDWFTNIADALKIADDKFTEYALNPGKFLFLVEGMVGLINAEDLAGLNRDSLATLADLVQKSGDFTKNIDKLWGAMADVRKSFPDEVEAVLDEQFKPVVDFWTGKIQGILDRIGSIAEELRPEIDRLIELSTKPLRTQLDELAPWVSAMYRFLGWGIPDARLQSEYLDRIFTEGILADQASLFLDSAAFDALREIHKPESVEVDLTPPGSESVPIPYEYTLTMPPASSRWYVGERKSPASSPAPWFGGES